MAQHIDLRLLSLIEQSEGMTWIFMKNLQAGDVLEVQTQNTLYTIKVVDPEKRRVLINSNGRHIAKETEATVGGSSLTGTGTMMKMGGIAIGLRLLIFQKEMDPLLLSATKEVRVNVKCCLQRITPGWPK